MIVTFQNEAIIVFIIINIDVGVTTRTIVFVERICSKYDISLWQDITDITWRGVEATHADIVATRH